MTGGARACSLAPQRGGAGMTVAAAEILLAGIAAYGAAGLLVGISFLLFGLSRLDPVAEGAYAFRPLLLPGLILFWPLVVRRWRQGPR